VYTISYTLYLFTIQLLALNRYDEYLYCRSYPYIMYLYVDTIFISTV